MQALVAGVARQRSQTRSGTMLRFFEIAIPADLAIAVVGAEGHDPPQAPDAIRLAALVRPHGHPGLELRIRRGPLQEALVTEAATQFGWILLFMAGVVGIFFRPKAGPSRDWKEIPGTEGIFSKPPLPDAVSPKAYRPIQVG